MLNENLNKVKYINKLILINIRMCFFCQNKKVVELWENNNNDNNKTVYVNFRRDEMKYNK